MKTLIEYGPTPPDPSSGTVLWYSTALSVASLSPSPQNRTAIITPSYAYEGCTNITNDVAGACFEPSLFFANGKWHCFYSANFSSTTLGYAVADHPLGPWTKQQSLNSTILHSFVYVEANVAYLYYFGGTGVGFQVRTQSLTDASWPTNWSGATTLFGGLLPPGVTTSLGGNLGMVKSGGVYYLFFEAKWQTNTQWNIGVATGTSPTGPFTVQAFPLGGSFKVSDGNQDSYGGPMPVDDGSGTPVLFYHAGNSSGGLDGQLRRAVSIDGSWYNWQADPEPFGRAMTIREMDQMADISVAKGALDGSWWAAWGAYDNKNQTASVMVSPLSPALGRWNGIAWDYLPGYADPQNQRALKFPIKPVTGNGSDQPYDDVVVDLTSGNAARTLPKATWGARVRYRFVGTGANTGSISPNGSDTIAGGNITAQGVGAAITLEVCATNQWCKS